MLMSELVGIIADRSPPLDHGLTRLGWNPRTGAAVYVEEQWWRFFRADKLLHTRLNHSGRR